MSYCPSCNKGVVAGLSYCNHCGFKLTEKKGDDIKSLEIRPEFLISAMVGLFIFGLVAIGILIGILKQGGGFDFSILLALTLFSFTLLLMVEGVFTFLLLRRKRVEREVTDSNRLNEQAINEIYTPPAQALSEAKFQPASVTEHTTRTLEPTPKVNS
jgi:uncharacterized protein YneF (UPF0154 family)